MIATILLAALAMPAPPPAAPRGLALLPLVGAAPGRIVDGELRCAFAGPRGATLLLAAADVGRRARPTAAIRFGHAPMRLLGTATGGFGALSRGSGFRGAGVAATVTRGARIATGSEEARHRATLRVTRGGASRLYRGVWTCGP